jgi:hypothetical protein
VCACIAFLGMILLVIHSLSLVLATLHCDIDKESNCILHKELVITLVAHRNGCTQKGSCFVKSPSSGDNLDSYALL